MRNAKHAELKEDDSCPFNQVGILIFFFFLFTFAVAIGIRDAMRTEKAAWVIPSVAGSVPPALHPQEKAAEEAAVAVLPVTRLNAVAIAGTVERPNRPFTMSRNRRR